MAGEQISQTLGRGSILPSPPLMLATTPWAHFLVAIAKQFLAATHRQDPLLALLSGNRLCESSYEGGLLGLSSLIA